MDWYDQIAGLYDPFTACFYKKARRDLVNTLQLKHGSRILVIACGTGQSFSGLEKNIGESGEIVAFDLSPGMLRYAEKRIVKNKWKNIRLFQADALELPVKMKELDIEGDFDVVLGELAFSVFPTPEWKKIMLMCVGLLKEGGRLGILDWYRPRNDVLTRIIGYFAQADVTRNTREYASFLMATGKVVSTFFGENVFTWIGKK